MGFISRETLFLRLYFIVTFLIVNINFKLPKDSLLLQSLFCFFNRNPILFSLFLYDITFMFVNQEFIDVVLNEELF